MSSRFFQYVRNSPARIGMPIAVYPGAQLTGAHVVDLVTNPRAQADAVLALHERFHTPILLSAMDLSAEAETFGCAIRVEAAEIPTVTGRRASSAAEIRALPRPHPGDRRTAVHLEAARLLVQQADGAPVLGELIGPFSLAGRIFGVSESLELSAAEPELLEELLQKTTAFLLAYVKAFKQQGVAGVILAEPTAGLLSPRGLARFSSTWVRSIVAEVQSADFCVILHNCGAKLAHLPKILESGVEGVHFGAPMDLPAALSQVGEGVLLAGNLDPAKVFLNGGPEVEARTRELLASARNRWNFVPSSGCDLPPDTPLEAIQAFFATLEKDPA